ncbi:MAG: phosphoribosyltransferase family protein [Henriciella sp.]|nr:phosphoribosyltransferase family protein [Henriciella sp.]
MFGREGLFKDRQEAGQRLATYLLEHDVKVSIVYALLRGGLPVAREVAKALGAVLDVILVRKLGVPNHPELAFGALVTGEPPEIVLNPEIVRTVGLGQDEIDQQVEAETREIHRREAIYSGYRDRADPQGCDVMVVDDGLATGATMIASIKALKKSGARSVTVAAPVASMDALQRVRLEADQVFILETPVPFHAVGYWYDQFEQLSDSDVIRELKRSTENQIETGVADEPV